jgi:hypothetical protein
MACNSWSLLPSKFESQTTAPAITGYKNDNTKTNDKNIFFLLKPTNTFYYT